MKIPENPKVARISIHYIADQLLQVFNLEKGMGYAIKWMLLDPGKAIQEYLYEDRKRMVKPISFLVLVTAVATYLTLTYIFKEDTFLQQLHADPDWEHIPDQFKPVIDQLMLVTQKYFNLAYMNSIPFISLASFWVFKEAGMNWAEHLVLNSYVYCMQTILLILGMPFLLKWPEAGLIFTILLIVYLVYAYCRIFELNWLKGLGKTILVYLIYGFFSSILIAIFAIIILQSF